TVIRHLRLPMRAPLRLVAAAQAPIVAVVGGDTGVLVDLQDPRNPALHAPFPLRIGPAGAVPHDLALDARGRTLALLVSQGNQLVPFDVRDPAQPQRLAE